MRTLGSKVEMYGHAQTRGANDLIWARMDFRYGGDYTVWFSLRALLYSFLFSLLINVLGIASSWSMYSTGVLLGRAQDVTGG